MLKPPEVEKWVTEKFEFIVLYITQIANIYVKEGMDEQMVLYSCLPDAAEKATAVTAAAYRSALIDVCNEYEAPPEAANLVMAVPLPAPPVAPVVAVVPRPPVYRAQFAAEIDRLRGLRSATSFQHGKLLANAAKNMRDWFHWVKSGPREPNSPGGTEGVMFGPKTAWSATATDAGLDIHGPKSNEFAAWLVDGGNPPDRSSHMNCWESVLFSAYRAGLVDRLRLQMIYRKAGLAYEINFKRGKKRGTGEDESWRPSDARNMDGRHGGQDYLNALSHAFNFFASVPFQPRAGLVPREGDILFWDQNEHVAIALGRAWQSGEAQDKMMSLWHHKGGRFSLLNLDDMPQDMRKPYFVPCPF